MDAAHRPGTDRATPPAAELPLEAPEERQIPSADTGDGLLSWVSMLSLVFLASATLNSAMRWCARGTSWDGAGALLSGVLGFVVYRLTISDNMLPGVKDRWLASLLPLLAWALLLPVVMRGLGFPG